jgi:hypothetical protein
VLRLVVALLLLPGCGEGLLGLSRTACGTVVSLPNAPWDWACLCTLYVEY